METLTVGFAAPAKHWIPWLAAVVGFSLIFNMWNLRFSYWTRFTLMIGATLNFASAVLLLCMSRLPAIVADSAAVVHERVISIELVNSIIAAGFFWVGLWLLFECGRDIYRIRQLSQTL